MTDRRQHREAVPDDQQGEVMETTLCWKCCAEYDNQLAKCPDCGAANANVDFMQAQKEVFGDDLPNITEEC